MLQDVHLIISGPAEEMNVSFRKVCDCLPGPLELMNEEAIYDLYLGEESDGE